jgi:hypothetical protein
MTFNMKMVIAMFGKMLIGTSVNNAAQTKKLIF